MDPLLDLPLEIPLRGTRERTRALHRQLRSAIVERRLQAGVRLPSTRALADALGVSRNTAVAVYDLLLSEGYLAARPGSGTFVADFLPEPPRAKTGADDGKPDGRLNAFWRQPPPLLGVGFRDEHRFDFRVGVPDIASFPVALWRRLSWRALRSMSRQSPAYETPEGTPALRRAITKHTSFARAVACSSEDIVVTAGAQQAFDLIARVLVTPGRTIVAVEEPGYRPMRDAFAAAGAKLVRVPVDDDGMIVERLPSRADIVCVTPSHQFPLGSALSPARRKALLDFASSNRAVIVEDDYDGEFRYTGKPLDALQTLDRDGNVLYVGTFSKSVFPALRTGFIAAPSWIRGALLAAKQTSDWHNPAVMQETLAAFVSEGHLARHVRKMRRVYGRRRDALLAALARHGRGRLRPMGVGAGLHMAARLENRVRGSELAALAAERGIGLHVVSDSRAAGDAAAQLLLFGYGSIRAEDTAEGVRRLVALL